MSNALKQKQDKKVQVQAGASESDRQRVVLSFSGGKDSCLALYRLQQDPFVEVVGLLTTVGTPYQRVSHHGVRRELLEAQAQSIGLPLTTIEVDAGMADCAAMSVYEQKMADAVSYFLDQQVDAIAFGDLFLEDLRRYRQARNSEVGMSSLFPIWGSETQSLAKQFIDDGFKAVVTCIDREKMQLDHLGQNYDASFLKQLDSKVDWCGEYGEFHTFVWDGPVFRWPIQIQLGERLIESKRAFIDLLAIESVS